MTETIVFFNPGSSYPFLERFASKRRGAVATAILALSRDMQRRRNVRSREYMQQLLKEAVFSKDAVRVLEVDSLERLPQVDWSNISEVILLWPDGNGVGWAGIERQVFAQKPSSCQISVLNGRRRYFAMSRSLWLGFKLRRVIEKTLVLELAFTLLFFIVTPGLVISDLIRGRR